MTGQSPRSFVVRVTAKLAMGLSITGSNAGSFMLGADSVQVEPHASLRPAPLGTSPTLRTAVRRKLPFAFQTCVLAEH